jgi:hypothetical protein
VAGSLAAVVGSRVGPFLDRSPRRVMFEVRSEGFQYTREGEPLHTETMYESFRFTVTMHADHSVEGVTTIKDYLNEVVPQGEFKVTTTPLTVVGYFSSSEGEAFGELGLSSGLTPHEVRHARGQLDSDRRAGQATQDKADKYIRAFQQKCSRSDHCTFELTQTRSYAQRPWHERALVTIFKFPLRIAVSGWTRAPHCAQSWTSDEYDETDETHFEVASVRLVSGTPVDAPVFS